MKTTEKAHQKLKSFIKYAFSQAFKVYLAINGFLGNVIIKKVAIIIFGAKEDGGFIRLMNNIYVANLFYVLALNFLAGFLAYPYSAACYYWAIFNVLVICGKALMWDSKSKKILEED